MHPWSFTAALVESVGLGSKKGTTTSSTARGRSSGARRANERSVLFRTSADFLVLRVKKYPGINQPYFSPSRLARRENNVYGVVVEESEGGGLNKKKNRSGRDSFHFAMPVAGYKGIVKSAVEIQYFWSQTGEKGKKGSIRA